MTPSLRYTNFQNIIMTSGRRNVKRGFVQAMQVAKLELVNMKNISTKIKFAAN